MEFKVTVLKGDGIGPDIVEQTIKVLGRIEEKYGHKFIYDYQLIGGAAIDECGTPLPDETVESALASDAVFLGAVGGPKWDDLPGDQRPEAGLLAIRKALGVYANLRPVKIYTELTHYSPLRTDVLGDGLDIMIVRELTGGIYFGDHVTTEDDEGIVAYDIEKYHKYEIERIARMAFDIAGKRSGRVTSVDKANVLDSSRLWRKTVAEIAEEYADIELDNYYVDNASMQLIKNPKHFDVLLTSNMFGDILSDEASQISGSIGMLPSASLGDGNFGLYEPIHGSAPNSVGKDRANPIATILSGAMMLRYTFGLSDEADDIENAVQKYLEAGYRTWDIAGDDTAPNKQVGTIQAGDLIASMI